MNFFLSSFLVTILGIYSIIGILNNLAISNRGLAAVNLVIIGIIMAFLIVNYR